MKSTSSSSSGGIGVFSLLGVLFVGLKLANIITWSWWWVMLPFWGSALLAIIAIIAIIAIAIITQCR